MPIVAHRRIQANRIVERHLDNHRAIPQQLWALARVEVQDALGVLSEVSRLNLPE